jgi:hypothetical protein
LSPLFLNRKEVLFPGSRHMKIYAIIYSWLAKEVFELQSYIPS